MTSTNTEWAGHAAGLVATLTDSGDLRDPAWAAAIAATPRHLLVPTAYQQQCDGAWDKIDTTGPGLGLAYSLTTLVTEIDNDGGPSPPAPSPISWYGCWKHSISTMDTECWRSAPAQATTPR
jgi:hypothetical protein